MNNKTKMIAINAMIAAIYAVLTVMVAPLSYGDFQMRFSEILIFLAFYDKRYIPGLIAGCFIANLFSPMLAYDLVFGVGATVFALIAMYHTKNKYLGAVYGALINGVFVGFELHLAFQLPFLITSAWVALGEFAVLVIGGFVFGLIENKPAFKKLYE